jgi:hypothetical protein
MLVVKMAAETGKEGKRLKVRRTRSLENSEGGDHDAGVELDKWRREGGGTWAYIRWTVLKKQPSQVQYAFLLLKIFCKVQSNLHTDN